MTGSLLKTIIAKMLSSRFHKAAHFDKLQDALHKVSHMLPQSGNIDCLGSRTSVQQIVQNISPSRAP